MSSYSTTSSRQVTTPGVQAGPHRLYVFAVLALAAFLLLTAIGRQPNERYEATAVLHRTVVDGDSQAVSADSLYQVLTSDEMLQVAIHNMATETDDPGLPVTPAELRDGISISPQSPEMSANFQVLCAGQDPTLMTTLANQICRQFVERQRTIHANEEEAAVPTPAAVDDRTTEAEAAVRQAREQLDQFVEETMFDPDEMEDQVVAGSQTEPAATESDAADAETAALAERIAQLKEQRQQLLVEMTSQHPRVQSLTSQIEDLQASMPVTSEPPAAPEPATDLPTVDPAAVRRSEQLAAYERLKQQVADAEASLETARLASRREPPPRVAAPRVDTWHMSSATVALPVRDPIAVPSLLLAVACGLTCGGGALLALPGGTINDIGGAEQVWDAPVLGTLTESGKTVPSRGRRRDRILGWLVPCGEIVLFVFLAAMIAAALLDRSVAAQFRDDPLAALVDGVPHLTHIAWR